MIRLCQRVKFGAILGGLFVLACFLVGCLRMFVFVMVEVQMKRVLDCWYFPLSNVVAECEFLLQTDGRFPGNPLPNLPKIHLLKAPQISFDPPPFLNIKLQFPRHLLSRHLPPPDFIQILFNHVLPLPNHLQRPFHLLNNPLMASPQPPHLVHYDPL